MGIAAKQTGVQETLAGSKRPMYSQHEPPQAALALASRDMTTHTSILVVVPRSKLCQPELLIFWWFFFNLSFITRTNSADILRCSIVEKKKALQPFWVVLRFSFLIQIFELK